ncbi:TRAP transporter small permease [uncultured Sphaerochaeta sp.]|uniref:TRAP transporter small permease n=1 Tax=uncultured Sphaerochaeta sp. TaxID=886478 RepID=UPI0029C60CFC|nr:TRAP transporter small permease [uncultured Sphaerochaeta sp.]
MVVIRKILDGFVKCISVLLMILVAGIVLLMLNELVLRNLLGSSFKGMTELSGFMFLWMAFLGIIVLYDQNRMISLDMFFVRTKGRLRTVLWVIQRCAAILLGIVMILAFKGLYPFISTEFYSSMPSFSKMYQYVPMVITGAFLCVKSMYDLVVKARGENVS